MLRYPLIILRRSQRILIIGAGKDVFQIRHQLAQPLLVLGCEATEDGAVDIQNANNLISYHQRQYDLRITGGITGDMPVKHMNIFHTLYLILGHRSTAYTAPDRNTHASQFARTGQVPACHLP